MRIVGTDLVALLITTIINLRPRVRILVAIQIQTTPLQQIPTQIQVAEAVDLIVQVQLQVEDVHHVEVINKRDGSF
jgi:hypothetical protein